MDDKSSAVSYLMCLHVLLDVRLLSERAATHDTLERFLARVRPHVLLEVEVLGEQFVAVLTLEPLLESDAAGVSVDTLQ